MGAEGWEDLYSYSVVFSKERQAYEDGAFWFMDGVHTPEVIEPWDATIVEYALIALSQYNTRHYVIPPARGVDIRILNGYMYLSPGPGLGPVPRSSPASRSSWSAPASTSATGRASRTPGCPR